MHGFQDTDRGAADIGAVPDGRHGSGQHSAADVAELRQHIKRLESVVKELNGRIDALEGAMPVPADYVVNFGACSS